MNPGFHNVRGLLGFALVIAACGARVDAPPLAPALPPEKHFAAYPAVELKPIQVNPAYAGNDRATSKIERVMTDCMHVVFPRLNAAAPAPAVSNAPAKASKGTAKPTAGKATTASSPAATRVLVVEPYIEDIKFVNAAARVFVGVLAGDSDVHLKVTFRDRQTGEVLAAPVFHATSPALGARYGIEDNKMLSMVAEEACKYVSANR